MNTSKIHFELVWAKIGEALVILVTLDEIIRTNEVKYVWAAEIMWSRGSDRNHRIGTSKSCMCLQMTHIHNLNTHNHNEPLVVVVHWCIELSLKMVFPNRCISTRFWPIIGIFSNG